MPETGTTCGVASEYLRQNVGNFGNETKCNEARINATLSGCECKDDIKDESEQTDLVKCVVCENGLSNPELFVDAIEA